MLATCLEASCNGETPWEEASDRARGEEEERAGRVFDWLDELGTRAPKRQGRVDQRLGKHTPGSSLVYSQF
jgi:hypothetical protein